MFSVSRIVNKRYLYEHGNRIVWIVDEIRLFDGNAMYAQFVHWKLTTQDLEQGVDVSSDITVYGLK